MALVSRWLGESHGVTAEELTSIEEEVEREIVAAVEFALEAPFPDPSEVTEHVYA